MTLMLLKIGVALIIVGALYGIARLIEFIFDLQDWVEAAERDLERRTKQLRDSNDDNTRLQAEVCRVEMMCVDYVKRFEEFSKPSEPRARQTTNEHEYIEAGRTRVKRPRITKRVPRKV